MHAREEPDFSVEAGALARHLSPCSGRPPDGRRINEIGKPPAGSERSGDPADFCFKRSRPCPRSSLSTARGIVSRMGEDAA